MRQLPTVFRRMSEYHLSSSQVVTSLYSQRSNWDNFYLFHKKEKKQHKKSFTIKSLSSCYSTVIHSKWWIHPDDVKRVSKRQKTTSGCCFTRLRLWLSFIFKAETKQNETLPESLGFIGQPADFWQFARAEYETLHFGVSNSWGLIAFRSTDVLKWG